MLKLSGLEKEENRLEIFVEWLSDCKIKWMPKQFWKQFYYKKHFFKKNIFFS